MIVFLPVATDFCERERELFEKAEVIQIPVQDTDMKILYNWSPCILVFYGLLCLVHQAHCFPSYFVSTKGTKSCICTAKPMVDNRKDAERDEQLRIQQEVIANNTISSYQYFQ